MISGWRSNVAARGHAGRLGRVGRGADRSSVLVRLAALRRVRHRPAVERVAVVLERRRARPRRDHDVVDEDAGEVEDVVAGVAERQLDVLARVRREVDDPLLVAVAHAADRVPRARRPDRVAAAVGVLALVVLEERVQAQPERAREAGVLARVAVDVGQRRPVVDAGGVRLDEEEVPVLLGVARDPERQPATGGGHVDRAHQPLERRLRDVARARTGCRCAARAA